MTFRKYSFDTNSVSRVVECTRLRFLRDVRPLSRMMNYSHNYNSDVESSIEGVADPARDACRRYSVQGCCNARTMWYIRKEGINRDNSRLGVFEMTAIRGTRSPSLSFSSLLAERSLGPNDKLCNSEISRARLALCTCEKSQPTANRVTPLLPHAGIWKRDYGRSSCDQLSVPHAEIRKVPIKPSAITRDRP